MSLANLIDSISIAAVANPSRNGKYFMKYTNRGSSPGPRQKSCMK